MKTQSRSTLTAVILTTLLAACGGGDIGDAPGDDEDSSFVSTGSSMDSGSGAGMGSGGLGSGGTGEGGSGAGGSDEGGAGVGGSDVGGSGAGGSGEGGSGAGGSGEGGSGAGGQGIDTLLDRCDPLTTNNIIQVSGAGGLQSALNAAQPGDHVVLANGTYSGTFSLNNHGTAAAPIVVRSQNPQGATFTGQLFLNGDYTEAHGLKAITDSGHRIRLVGDHTGVYRTRFIGPDGVRVQSPTEHWTIACNYFSGNPPSSTSRRHIYVRCDDKNNFPEHGLIARNRFESNNDQTNSESMHVYVGDQFNEFDPWLQDFVVEYNYVNTTRRRAFYSKFAGTFRYNHILATRGNTGFRGGNQSEFYGNRIDGLHEIIMRGNGHVLIGNVWTNTVLNLYARHTVTYSPKVRLPAHQALLIGNSGPVNVGHIVSGSLVQNIQDVIIEDHQGNINHQHDNNTTISNQASLPVVQAVTLTPADVGLSFMP